MSEKVNRAQRGCVRSQDKSEIKSMGGQHTEGHQENRQPAPLAPRLSGWETPGQTSYKHL